MALTLQKPQCDRQALPYASEVETLFAQTVLLFQRRRRGLPLDPRSLRNLARVAERIAVTEERRA